MKTLSGHIISLFLFSLRMNLKQNYIRGAFEREIAETLKEVTESE